MSKTYVVSSNISCIGYENGILEITFRSGSVYEYFDIPEHTGRDLMSAASKGKYFHRHIKGRYLEIKTR